MNEVGIIGGGISGLSLAYELTKNMKPDEITIFERNNYFGGRIRTINWHDYNIDIGAQFFTNQDFQSFKLIKELNLEDKLKKLNMDFSICYDNKIIKGTLINIFRNLSFESKKEFITLFYKLKILKNKLDKISPYDLDSEYTSKTFYCWYSENIGINSINLIDILLRSICFTTSKKISALYGLTIVSALTDKCYSFINGISEIVDRLIEKIKNTNLNLNTEIENIDFIDKKILVNHTKFSKVIFTIPFTEVKRYLKDFNNIKINYCSCSFITVKINDKASKNGFAVLPPIESKISMILNERFKYSKKSNSTNVLGIIIPFKNEKVIFDEKRIYKILIDELPRTTGLSEEDIQDFKIFNWNYALPVCSPSFHKSLNQIKSIKLNNMMLCGDYTNIPSLDGSIESSLLCANRILVN